jgi:lipopolysaccharide/colanic/teichoic acid biosynthesis glycosyltransferase
MISARCGTADGGDQDLIASRKPRAPIDQTGISTVTAGKHAASLTSHDAFFHGLGPYLRYTRIDDLHQLINVLRGEISIMNGAAYSPSFLD